MGLVIRAPAQYIQVILLAYLYLNMGLVIRASVRFSQVVLLTYF
jgi:hypothetical protein